MYSRICSTWMIQRPSMMLTSIKDIGCHALRGLSGLSRYRVQRRSLCGQDFGFPRFTDSALRFVSVGLSIVFVYHNRSGVWCKSTLEGRGQWLGPACRSCPLKWGNVVEHRWAGIWENNVRISATCEHRSTLGYVHVFTCSPSDIR